MQQHPRPWYLPWGMPVQKVMAVHYHPGTLQPFPQIVLTRLPTAPLAPLGGFGTQSTVRQYIEVCIFQFISFLFTIFVENIWIFTYNWVCTINSTDHSFIDFKTKSSYSHGFANSCCWTWISWISSIRCYWNLSVLFMVYLYWDYYIQWRLERNLDKYFQEMYATDFCAILSFCLD